MPLYLWSQTAATNASADSTINWAEGQAPSSVNDSARGMMAAVAKYRDDIAGSIVTGGISTAYTVTTNSGFDTLSHLAGQVVAFTPHTTNGATVTLNVDSLGAKPLRTAPSVELQSNTLIQGTPYAAIYNSSDGAFYLFGVGGAPGIPLGSGVDFWGSTTPSSAFAFPTGQAISRTTYATLFSLIGTTYGTGDGLTTFNLPNKQGRVSAMLDATGGYCTYVPVWVRASDTTGRSAPASSASMAPLAWPSIFHTSSGCWRHARSAGTTFEPCWSDHFFPDVSYRSCPAAARQLQVKVPEPPTVM